MTVHLGGGGDEHDEALLWDEVFLPGRRVALWPFAMAPGAQRDGSVRWFRAALAARGEFTVQAWGVGQDGEDGGDGDLTGVDVVALPGGNTFDLVQEIRQRGLWQPLRTFLDGGGLVYGGSAGAVLLGADIAIAEGLDPNHAGVTDTHGFDRVAGAVLRPHHEPSLTAELRHWSRRHGRVVIGLPERSGLVSDGTRARAVGPEPLHLVTPDGAERELPAGTTWRLTGG
ncbi:Type 1 glutamine amidotransferase-like domain-containing protein [Kineococcus sp. NBC_00420]|uniref:Type 1 glutamine amidotransferase-like domain-containing protein n=1 Tax=Kineococcus sp. NBC_00420 TaxID=2903564 RepID=UPI002E1B6E30